MTRVCLAAAAVSVDARSQGPSRNTGLRGSHSGAQGAGNREAGVATQSDRAPTRLGVLPESFTVGASSA